MGENLLVKIFGEKEHNIFQGNITDALIYMILYRLVPTIVTWLSLYSEVDNLAVVYFYVTTLITISGIGYDIYSRWRINDKITRIKLSIICVPVFVIFSYSLYEILHILISNRYNRYDEIFYVYILSWIIAFEEFIVCFLNSILSAD